MPKCHWLPFLTAIGLAAAIALLAVLLQWENQREAAYQAAQEQYQDSKRPLPAGATVDYDSGITDAKTYREEWRSEQDLKAQREMSQWTRYMLYVSAIGVVAAVIGIIYVARTLKATRESVEHAAKSAEAAEQSVREARRQADAMISLEAGKLVIESIGLSHPDEARRQQAGPPIEGHIVVFSIKNIGKTAVFLKSRSILWNVSASPPEARYPLFTGEDWPVGVFIAPDRSLTIRGERFPISINEENRDAIEHGQKHFWAYGIIRFEDWFGIERDEEYLFIWKGRPAPNEPLPYSLGFKPFDRSTYTVQSE